MTHTLYRAQLRLHGAFGTPLAGDTLFGQICWAAREQLGEPLLHQLLDGYTAGRPWMVVSDGFPSGFLPRPVLPPSIEGKFDEEKRKSVKASQWVPLEATSKPLEAMLATAVSGGIAFGEMQPVETAQPHNTLNRLTGTTGAGEFAPYTQQQIFFAQNQAIDIYLSLDSERMNSETLKELLQAVGMQGYGRDASIGLGKFHLDALDSHHFPTSVLPSKTRTFWTLAPCAPQGLGFDPEASYWRVITRFGRHGGRHALAANAFKNPVLFAAAGALFTIAEPVDTPFIGQGLGGKGLLSKAEPATVHQGYAPAIAVCMEKEA